MRNYSLRVETADGKSWTLLFAGKANVRLILFDVPCVPRPKSNFEVSNVIG